MADGFSEGVTFDRFPGYVLHNARGMRRLYDEEGEEITTFPLARTDGEVCQYLTGWQEGRRVGKQDGERETKAVIRRALGIT